MFVAGKSPASLWGFDHGSFPEGSGCPLAVACTQRLAQTIPPSPKVPLPVDRANRVAVLRGSFTVGRAVPADRFPSISRGGESVAMIWYGGILAPAVIF